MRTFLPSGTTPSPVLGEVSFYDVQTFDAGAAFYTCAYAFFYGVFSAHWTCDVSPAKRRSVEFFSANCKLDLLDTGFYTATSMFPYKLPGFPFLLILGAMFLIGVGCGGKTIQHPEDHERYLRIDRAVESLRQAYVKKDSSNLASLMMPIDQLELLKEEAEGDFEAFTTIALDFAIERIMIEGDNVDVFVHWQGLWKKNPDDPGLRQRGHAKLQWVGTQSILLRGVQGDAPFGMKARQAAVDPARSPKKK